MSSSLTGSFQSCTDGSHSGSITCSGNSCAKLNIIPGLTCTTAASGVTTCTSNSNANGCAKASNLTSSFAVQGNGLTITQTHNITIGTQTYHLNGTGANFTKTTAGSKSSAYPASRPSFKLLAFVGFLLFCSQAWAATSQQLQAIDEQYASSFNSILDPLNTAVCKAAESGSATTTTQQIGLELDALTTCLKGLMNTLLDLEGALVQNGTAFGESLPITDADSLFVAAIADIFLCLALTEAIWIDPSKVNTICGPVLGNTPTVTATPTQSTDASAPTETSVNVPFPVPGPGLPPNWPSADAWLGSASCMSCMFALVYLNSLNDTMEPYEPACDITNIPVSAADLSVWLCNPAYGTADFTPMCNYLCENPCQTWGANAIQAGLPEQLWQDANPNLCLDKSVCTANQTLGNDYGNYTCPGTQLDAYTTLDPIQPCLCGTGFNMCLPVPYNLTDGPNNGPRNHCTDEGGP